MLQLIWKAIKIAAALVVGFTALTIVLGLSGALDPDTPEEAAAKRAEYDAKAAKAKAAAAEAAKKNAAAAKESEGNMARVMAREFVKQNLKSPSSAEFGSVWDGTIATVEDLGSGVWEVRGIVDAQNAFGATLRSKWLVRLKRADGDEWQASTVRIE